MNCWVGNKFEGLPRPELGHSLWQRRRFLGHSAGEVQGKAGHPCPREAS